MTGQLWLPGQMPETVLNKSSKPEIIDSDSLCLIQDQDSESERLHKANLDCINFMDPT
jgi:hypothetical protein